MNKLIRNENTETNGKWKSEWEQKEKTKISGKINNGNHSSNMVQERAAKSFVYILFDIECIRAAENGGRKMNEWREND